MTVSGTQNKCLDLPILLSSWRSKKDEVGAQALIDSGAEDNFIDNNFAKLMGFETMPLDEPIKVYNIDGTRNKEGINTEFVQVMLEVQGRTMHVDLLATGLGRNKVILGLPWLEDMNLDIDWKQGTINWRNTLNEESKEKAKSSSNARFMANILSSLFEEEEKVKDILNNDLTVSYISGKPTKELEDVWICAAMKMNKSTALTAKANEKKEKKTIEE
jgi:hypothetical protein